MIPPASIYRLCSDSIVNFGPARIVRFNVRISGDPGILSELVSMVHRGGLLNCDTRSNNPPKNRPRQHRRAFGFASGGLRHLPATRLQTRMPSRRCLPGSMTWKQDQPEPAVVVPKARAGAAAARRAADPGVAVPAAAAYHPGGAVLWARRICYR